MMTQTTDRPRLRAPSKRSLATKTRILDSAERLFAARGFDGASIRDIAKDARVQGALVAHHGGSKEELFYKVVARRAEELAALRIAALNAALAQGTPSLRDVLRSFVQPLFDKVQGGDAAWAAYGRLIAFVSADERWRDLARDCFDPTARVFIATIGGMIPKARPEAVAARFVFMVSASLSIITSTWRVQTLSQEGATYDLVEDLLNFATAGFEAL